MATLTDLSISLSIAGPDFPLKESLSAFFRIDFRFVFAHDC
jgi:hypothetical protein